MKKEIAIISVIFLAVFLISFTSASVTVVNPGASATLTGSAVLNATGVNLDNCTFYAKSASTANSSWSTLGTFTNVSSADATFVNGTFSSLVLEDSNDYVFNATCRNLSNSVHDGTRTGIIVQNTVPQTPSALVPASASVDEDGTVTFSSTVTAGNTTGCTLLFESVNPGESSYTMTHSGSTCTYSSIVMPEQSYTYYVRASDGTDTTDSAHTTFRVDVKTSAGKAVALIQSGVATANADNSLTITSFADQNKTPIIIIVLIALALILVYKYRK